MKSKIIYLNVGFDYLVNLDKSVSSVMNNVKNNNPVIKFSMLVDKLDGISL
jgi:hypothetical protein